MRRWALMTAFLCAAACWVPYGARAQNASPAQDTSSTASQPAPGPEPAQNAGATTTPPPSSSPAKRVWTNDDVGDLRGHSTISTVGVAKTKPEKQTNKPVANPETVRSYRERIVRLQGELPDLDSKIAELQGVLNGDTVNSTRHATGTKIDDWHDELAKLQQQRTDVAAKISTLQDQARHNGVPENEIPE
jgi:uncharacterized protein YukE